MFTVMTNGKVSSRAMMQNAQAARNLPITACAWVIGSVSNSSIVPSRRSSAQSRMVMAGTSSRNTHGMKLKNGTRSAWSRSKKLPRLKVSTPCKARKMTMNTTATGVAK